MRLLALKDNYTYRRGLAKSSVDVKSYFNETGAETNLLALVKDRFYSTHKTDKAKTSK